MNFRTHMSSLRVLVNDYYENKMSFIEYREQRSQLLRLIDEELNGVKIIVDEDSKDITVRNSMIGKALSFLTNR